MVKKINFEKLSEIEKGWLVGLFIGDGYAFFSKKDIHYQIFISLNNDMIIRKTIHLFNLINSKPYICNGNGCKDVRVNSKILFNFFNQMTNKVIFKNNSFSLGLVSGFIDAEGYVGNGEIVVCQKDKEILMKISRWCWKNNIKTNHFITETHLREKRFRIHRLRISTNFKYLPHNSIKITMRYKQRGGVAVIPTGP